jgi:hypothetical protein
MELGLSHDKQVVLFPNLPITAGITTNLMGNFKSTAPGSESHIKILQHLTGTNCHGQLIPNHGTDISRFITGMTNEAVVGDATLYGNEQIGYFALIHCSWKTLGKFIISKAVTRMISYFSIVPNSMCAFIYPGICKTCYEVGPEVTNRLLNEQSKHFFQQISETRCLFDLSSYIQQQLMFVGINMNRVYTTPTCSAHSTMEVTSIKVKQPSFFSYRARQDSGRNAIFAKLPNDDKLILSTTGDCPYVILYALPD